MSALDRVIAASPLAQPLDLDLSRGEELDEGTELVMAAQSALSRAYILLASDPDNDGDDDSKGEDADATTDHASHATYKKMVKKGVNPKLAAKMCANADNKAAATAMLEGALVALSGLDVPDPHEFLSLAAPPGESASERRQSAKEGNALPDGSYPIPDVSHLKKAAILAASGHGNVSAAKALIRRRAKELGVDVTTLPGFGSSDSDEKAAATNYDPQILALAAKIVAPSLSHLPANHAFSHGPFEGMHSHPHEARVVVNGPHFHGGDGMHGRMIHP